MLLGLVAFPLFRLVPLEAGRRAQIGRTLVSRCFRSFLEFTRRARLMSFEVHGAAMLGRPGQLVLANHPSLLDVVFLIGLMPGPGCVVKRALWSNPFTAGVVLSAGYVPNAPADAMIEGASAALEAGQSVIMFPEGTRTTPGQPIRFHRGAASVAVRAARFVTPVYITVEPTTLTKHSPWYRIPPRRPHWSLVVGEDIDLAPFREGRALPMAGRALNDYLIGHFAARLTGAGGVSGDKPPTLV